MYCKQLSISLNQQEWYYPWIALVYSLNTPLITCTGAGLFVNSSYCAIPCSNNTTSPSTTTQPILARSFIACRSFVCGIPYATYPISIIIIHQIIIGYNIHQ